MDSSYPAEECRPSEDATAHLVKLLNWLRANDYIATSVTVGDVSVVVQDVGALKKASSTDSPARRNDAPLSIEDEWAKDLRMPPRPGSETSNGDDGDEG